eukprot:Rmarinus@m.10773
MHSPLASISIQKKRLSVANNGVSASVLRTRRSQRRLNLRCTGPESPKIAETDPSQASRLTAWILICLRKKVTPARDVLRLPHVLHVYGTDKMSTDDLMEYFADYSPSFIEWINDSSCNIHFADFGTAKRAFLSRSTGDDINEPERIGYVDEAKAEEASESVTGLIAWRTGIPFEKRGVTADLLLRFATVKDERGEKPNPASVWARTNMRKQKHGAPEDARAVLRGIRRKRNVLKRLGDRKEQRHPLDRVLDDTGLDVDEQEPKSQPRSRGKRVLRMDLDVTPEEVARREARLTRFGGIAKKNDPKGGHLTGVFARLGNKGDGVPPLSSESDNADNRREVVGDYGAGSAGIFRAEAAKEGLVSSDPQRGDFVQRSNGEVGG